MMENLPYIREAFDAYTMFKNYKLLPNKGGYYDQSSFFLSVVSFCDSIQLTYEKLNKEKEEALKDMASKAKNRSMFNGK